MKLAYIVCSLAIFVLLIGILGNTKPKMPITEQINQACAADLNPTECKIREATRVMETRRDAEIADEDSRIRP